MRPLRPLIWVTLILCLKAAALGGTSGILEGTVRDKRTGEPLPGVNVYVPGAAAGTVTGPTGQYSIANLRAGAYEVRFSLVGFRTRLVKNVTVNADLRTRLNAELESADVSLEEVVVVQEKPLIQTDVTSSAYFVSREEIRALPLSSVTDMVGLKPGTTLEGNVRGGRNNEVSYYVDGLSVQDLMGGGLGLKLPTSSVVNMSIYTGGFEPEYGNALSGVVNIVTRTGSDDHRFFVRGDADNLFGGTQVSKEKEVELGALGPLLRGKCYYTLAATGNVSGTRWWQDFERFFRGPNDTQLSGFGKIDYTFSGSLRLSGQLLYYQHDWRDYDFSWRLNLDGLPPEHRTAYRAAAILTHSVSDKFFYNLSLSHYSVRRTIGDGARGEVVTPYQYDFFLQYVTSGQKALWMRSSQQTTELKYDGTVEAFGEHLFKFGGEMNFYDLSSDIERREPRMTYFGRPLLGEPELDFSSAYDYHPRGGGLYIQDKIDVMKEGGALLNLGLRYDFLDPRASRPSIDPVLLGDTAYAFGPGAPVRASFKYRFSPRVGLGMQVAEKGYLFINLGFYFQNPLFDYLYTGLDRVALARGVSALTGNPDLEPEESTQWEVSFRYALPLDVVVSLAYFKKETTNLIDTKTFVPGDSKLAGNFGFAEFVNVPEASASGFELVLTRDRGEYLTGELSYTYMTTEGNSGSPYDGFYIAQFGLPPAIRSFPLSWDQRHTVKAAVDFHPGSGFALSLVAHWHTGRPYTNYPTATGFTPVAGGSFAENNARMPDYFSLDLKAEQKLTFGGWPGAELAFYVDLRNLTNEQNVSWMDSNGRIGGELGDPSGYFIGRRARCGVQLSF